MKYPLPQRLTTFMDTAYGITRALVIETERYVEEMRGIFPEAEIYFATGDGYKMEDAVNKYLGEIKYAAVAYNEERLPFKEGSFDVIIGDELLSENFNPQDIASGLRSFLKPTGYLLTTFSNLLFKPWIDKLTEEERSEFIVRRGYTRDDFERLMAASFFKEVFFEEIFSDTPSKEPPYYMARAYASVMGVRNLKSMYSETVRKEISKLLHRIEYDVNSEEATQALKRLMKKERVFEDYMDDFINEACYKREYVREYVREKAYGK